MSLPNAQLPKNKCQSQFKCTNAKSHTVVYAKCQYQMHKCPVAQNAKVNSNAQMPSPTLLPTPSANTKCTNAQNAKCQFKCTNAKSNTVAHAKCQSQDAECQSQFKCSNGQMHRPFFDSLFDFVVSFRFGLIWFDLVWFGLVCFLFFVCAGPFSQTLALA